MTANLFAKLATAINPLVYFFFGETFQSIKKVFALGKRQADTDNIIMRGDNKRPIHMCLDV